MYSVGRRTKRWPLCLFFNFLDVVAINSAVIYKAVKQDGGMARKDFIKQLALQLMRDALNMRNQAKILSRDLQVLIQKHAGTSSLELKPYVSYRTAEVIQSEFTSQDLFNAVYRPKIISDFNAGMLDEAGNPLEPSPKESLTAEQAEIQARQTGSDIFEVPMPEDAYSYELFDKTKHDPENELPNLNPPRFTLNDGH
ncbi:MRPL41 [Cordylochernes scorpioides]|uniref:MRPL41 n=1 Tax=Cordylochernes scorpioides TaxID=51811 RepID=A0ABY6LMS8_9ARAC|nr:MRPL41 [Cordylochernes scorpioides]